MAIRQGSSKPLHTPHFVHNSVRGSQVACECGNWVEPIPKVIVDAMSESINFSFLNVGFDMGRKYERHVEGGARE